MQWLPASRAPATPKRTTGPGRCARPPTAPCCAGWKTAAGGGLRRLRRAAQAEGPPDGHRPGGNLWRERRAHLRFGGRDALRQPRAAGPRGFCSRHRCRHGIDAGLPPGPGLCRLGAVGGGRRHPSGDRYPGRRGAGRGAIRTWETIHLGDEFEARRAPARCWRASSTSPKPWPRRCPLPPWAGGRQLRHSLSHDHFSARAPDAGESEARLAARQLSARNGNWPSNTACTRRSAGSGKPISPAWPFWSLPTASTTRSSRP
jgi:hypothetical protein